MGAWDITMIEVEVSSFYLFFSPFWVMEVSRSCFVFHSLEISLEPWHIFENSERLDIDILWMNTLAHDIKVQIIYFEV